jgi:hypothetical protein
MAQAEEQQVNNPTLKGGALQIKSMALLINHAHGERCECCAGSRRVSYCYAGANERCLERKPDGNWKHPVVDPSDAHAVTDPGLSRTGWFLRGGRLPICPEHHQEGDVPL